MGFQVRRADLPGVRRIDPEELAEALGGTVTVLAHNASRIDYTDADGRPRWMEVFQLRGDPFVHRAAARPQ